MYRFLLMVLWHGWLLNTCMPQRWNPEKVQRWTIKYICEILICNGKSGKMNHQMCMNSNKRKKNTVMYHVCMSSYVHGIWVHNVSWSMWFIMHSVSWFIYGIVSTLVCLCNEFECMMHPEASLYMKLKWSHKWLECWTKILG